MIKVWQPRWRDRRVLIARYRIPSGQDFKIEITQSVAKGVYLVRNEVVCKSPIETMKTRQGKTIQMRAVPLDELEKVKEEEQ